MGNTNYTFGDLETASVFDESSNHSDRIKKNSIKHKKDAIYDNISSFKINDTYGGMLVKIYDREYIFDVGNKTYVNVLLNSIENQYVADMEIGDFTELLILDIQDRKDQFTVYGSVAGAKQILVKYKISHMDDNIINVHIKDMNASGYNATFTIDGITLNAFMPHFLAGANKILESNREKLVGQSLDVCIDNYDSVRGTYVVDRKEYLRRTSQEMVKNLQKNVLYKGVVTGTADFGIFVEFNEFLTGMIYKTYISEENKDLEFKEGMEIEFYIKDISKDRIILTQVLKDSIWDSIKVGDKIDGVVKAVLANGVLISFDEETNGMIRKSDSLIDFKNYQIGSTITVDVINIDRSNRKIFLSDK